MQVELYNIKGGKTGKQLEVPAGIFDITPNEHLLYLAVKQFLANQRQGTHSTKTRGEVRGGGKKPWRQKGTGRARVGSIRSPLWRHGGVAHGPKPRDYSLKMNKKEKKLALKSALSSKMQAGEVYFIEDFSMETPSTKAMREFHKAFGLEAGKRFTFVFPSDSKYKNVYLSLRNFPKAQFATGKQLNTYYALNNSKLFIMEGAIEELVKRLLTTASV